MSGRDRAQIRIHIPRGWLLQDAEEEGSAHPEGGWRNGAHEKDASHPRLFGRAIPRSLRGDNLDPVLLCRCNHWCCAGDEHELCSQLFSSGDGTPYIA